jgi:hypothetical protein
MKIKLVWFIMVILLVGLVDAEQFIPLNINGAGDTANAAAQSAGAVPDKPANLRYMVDFGYAQEVYATPELAAAAVAHAKSNEGGLTPDQQGMLLLSRNVPVPVYKTPMGMARVGEEVPFAPYFKMDSATGKFRYDDEAGAAAGQTSDKYGDTSLEFDVNGRYLIQDDGGNALFSGQTIELYEGTSAKKHANGNPVVIYRQTNLQTNDVHLLSRDGHLSNPMSAELLNDVTDRARISDLQIESGNVVITTNSGSTINIQEDNTRTGDAGVTITTATITSKDGASQSKSEYRFPGHPNMRATLGDDSIDLQTSDGRSIKVPTTVSDPSDPDQTMSFVDALASNVEVPVESRSFGEGSWTLKKDGESLVYATEIETDVKFETPESVRQARRDFEEADSAFTNLQNRITDVEEQLAALPDPVTPSAVVDIVAEATEALEQAREDERIATVEWQRDPKDGPKLADKADASGARRTAELKLEEAKLEAAQQPSSITDAAKIDTQRTELQRQLAEANKELPDLKTKRDEKEKDKDEEKNKADVSNRFATKRTLREDPGGRLTEARTFTKNDEIIDIDQITESVAYVDDKGKKRTRVVAVTERASSGIFDIGRIDFGFFEVGGKSGGKLQRTIMGQNGQPAFVQYSAEFEPEKNGNIPESALGDLFDNDRPKFGALVLDVNSDTASTTIIPASVGKGFSAEDISQMPGIKLVGSGSTIGYSGGTLYLPEDLDDEGNPFPSAKAIIEDGVVTEAGKAELERRGLSDGQIEQVNEAQNQKLLAERAARFSSAQSFAADWGALSSMFAGKGSYGKLAEKWQAKFDQVFHNAVFGGTEFRISEICNKPIRKLSTQALVVATPTGELIPAAFANGERQEFLLPNGTKQYLYRISYKVQIPDSILSSAQAVVRRRTRPIDSPLPEPSARVIRTDSANGVRLEEFLAEGPFFNIKLDNKFLFVDTGTGDRLDEGVAKGARALGRNQLAFYSARDYKKVCVVFSQGIGFAGGTKTQQCSPIVDLSPVPTNVVSVPSSGVVGGGSSPSQGTVSSTETGQIGINQNLG